MEEDVRILEELLKMKKEYWNGIETLEDLGEPKEIKALENLIKGYRELDKDNNDLRRLYRRTAVKLKENEHEEVADYFLAQINEVPTFTVDDDIDYYSEYYKMKTKIRELEENLKIATAMLTKGTYPEKNKGDNDFSKQFIQISKIKEKIEELEECVKCLGNDGMELTYKESAEAQIQVLQELMEDK